MANSRPTKNADIQPDIRPHFGVIQGGGETSEPTGNLSEAPESNEQANNLKALEGGGESTPERAKLESVPDLETNPPSIPEIPFTGSGDASNRQQTVQAKISGFFNKKKRPLIGIIGGTGIIGILFSLFGPLTMVISLTENLQDTNNGAQSAFERRITKVLGLKLQDNDGLCKTTSVKCKMGRISTKGLQKLEKKGVTAYDSDGNKLSGSKGKYPDKKISEYEVEGFKDRVPAGQMKQRLANDSKIASRVLGRSGAFNVRFEIYRGKYFSKNFYERWKIGRNGGIADGENKKNTKIAEIMEKLKNKLPTSEGMDETARIKVKAKADKMIERGKKGGVAYLTAVGTCMGVKAPSMIANAVAAVQMTRLIQLAPESILSPGGKNKASLLSNISSEDVETVGKVFTTTDKNGKSALDSKYLQSAIGTNTNKTGISKDFAPGYSILSNPLMRQAKRASNTSESTCNAVLSPQAMYTAMAVNSTLTVAASATVIGGILKVAGEFAIGEMVSYVAVNAFEKYGGDLITKLAENDELTKALAAEPGEKTGDAIGISAMAFFSSGAAARNVPVLKKSQLTAYNNIQKEQAIAQRNQDLATLSPFDISSKYTFLGSLVNNMNMAILANGGARNYTTASLSYLMSSPLKTLSATTYAAGEAKSENYCAYAKDFDMEADGDMTPAVNAAGLPCYGYVGDLPTESAISIAEGNNSANEKWIKDDVEEDADLSSVVESDSRLADYIDGCGAASIENGEWSNTAAGCTIDTTTNTSRNVAGATPCAEGQSPDTSNCFENTDGVGETKSKSSNAKESEAVAAFAIDYQISQEVDGFDEEADGAAATSGLGADFTAASYNFCGEAIHPECPRGQAKANSIKSVITAKAGQSVAPFDIIGAQEVTRDTQKNLKTALPTYDSSPKPVAEYNGVGIFWNTDKFTQVGEGEIKNIAGNGGNKADHPWVKLQAKSGQIVYYLSIHSPKDGYGTIQDRTNNATKYLAWAKSVATGSNLVVIAGDFNAAGRTDNGKPSAYCVLTSTGILQNAVDRVKKSSDINSKCPSAKGVQIDQIYNSTNITTLTAGKFGRASGGKDVTGTDHNPVFVTYSIPAAETTGGAASGGAVGGDDYKTECSKYLKSGYYCPGQSYSFQCTAFVNFRLAKHGVIKPTDIVGGTGGKVVGTLTTQYGFEKGTTPQVNAVFSSPNSTGDGHTGMVSKVNDDGSIVVEEYNFSHPRAYGTRTLSKDQYKSFTFAYTGSKYK